jgi:hypothetical protein
LCTKRAFELSDAAEKYIRERGNSFTNIEVKFMKFPLTEALQECARRRDCTPDKLIEAMDGFHPR